MARCNGTHTCTTKVDTSMSEFIEQEASRLGISKAELLRRLLDFYREGRENDTRCPECGESIEIPLES